MEQHMYEFSREQNDILELLARRMKRIGMTNVVLSVLYLLTGVFFFLQHSFASLLFVPMVALFLLVGVWTNSLSSSFRRID